MPFSVKLVIGTLIVLLLLNVISLFMSFPAAGGIVAIVVQLALLNGFYNRQRVAWYVARWLSAIAVCCDVVILLIASIASGATLALIISAIASFVPASAFFYLLGRPDSRAYFNASQKA